MPLVDSHASGNRSVTLDTAASPSDIVVPLVAASGLLTPRSAAPNVGLARSVLAPSTDVDGHASCAVALDDDVDRVARLVRAHRVAEVVRAVDRRCRRASG